MTVTRIDNSDLRAKLEPRRYFLRKYHRDDPPCVLDCCQGDGIVWGHLRREFELGGYWGIDRKPKKGRLRLDSVRLLQQPGWTQNVVDVDTYGLPWKHWEALLPNVRRPLTVFLTIGVVRAGGGGGLDKAAAGVMGLDSLPIPPGISGNLHDLALPYLLTKAADYGIRLMEAVEADSHGNARYVGARLAPEVQPAQR